MHAPAYGGMLMLKLAALFATVTAALQCVLAERTLKIEQHVAEIQVISSDANARRLNLGFNKAMAIDLPTDLKEILVADPTSSCEQCPLLLFLGVKEGTERARCTHPRDNQSQDL